MGLKLQTIRNVKKVFLTTKNMIIIASILSLAIILFFITDFNWGIIIGGIGLALFIPYILNERDPVSVYDIDVMFNVNDSEIIIGEKIYPINQLLGMSVKVEGYRGQELIFNRKMTSTGTNNYLRLSFNNGEEQNVRLLVETEQEFNHLLEFIENQKKIIPTTNFEQVTN
jgi:hypothetical protein